MEFGPEPGWTPVAEPSQVPEGSGIVVKHAGEEVALFRLQGTFYACSERCPHAGGPLHMAFVRGTQISCPWHGWVFDLAVAENSPRDGVLRYPVRVEAERIWLGPALPVF